MNNSAYHLNLLNPSEHVSSSPVRLRVIAPMLAFLAILGMIVWWGSLFAQTLIVESNRNDLVSANENLGASEKKAKAVQDEFLEKEAQLRQLKGYEAGIRRISPALMALAVDFPMDIQLTELAISPLPPQDLRAATKKNPKAQPLRGPTNTVERQTFTIRGKTRNADLIETDLMRIMSDEALRPLYAGSSTPKTTSAADTATEATDSPVLHFTVEYAMPGRDFQAPKEDAK